VPSAPPPPPLIPAVYRGKGFCQWLPRHHAALRVESELEVAGHERHDVHPEELERVPLEGGLEGIAEKPLVSGFGKQVVERLERKHPPGGTPPRVSALAGLEAVGGKLGSSRHQRQNTTAAGSRKTCPA